MQAEEAAKNPAYRLEWAAWSAQMATSVPQSRIAHPWVVGAVEEYSNGQEATVISVHGMRAVLKDENADASEAFIPAERCVDLEDWVIVSDDENGRATYEAALAVVMGEAV